MCKIFFGTGFDLSPIQKKFSISGLEKIYINTFKKIKNMKTKLASLLVVLFLSATTQLSAQRFTVQPVNDDISYDLDLKAVASIFGDSRNLQRL